MNSDSNPYAPPNAVETEAPLGRYWSTDGIGVIAKHGTALPKIDLETGISDPNLKPLRHVLQSSSHGFQTLGVMAAIVAANSIWELPSIVLWGSAFCIFVLLNGLRTARTGAPIIVWSFSETQRAKRRKIRRRAIFVTGFGPMAALTIFSSELYDTSSWFLGIWGSYLLLMLGLGLWEVLDRPKFKLRAASPGWLSISPIHPAALDCLRQLEETQPSVSSPAHRKRLIRTAYFHRYPLRMLIGKHPRNPLIIFNIVLLKLLRSPQLVREIWHYSEAEELPLENLCAPLRQAAESWLAAHPDWTFVRGERLPSPAGDLVTESATFVSPGFEHSIHIARSWMEQRSAKGITTLSFHTWLADGTLVSTLDHPHLASHDPKVIHHRASGPPEQVFQSHLRHLAGQPVQPAAGLPDLLGRMEREKERTDRLLTKLRFQSEAREIAGFVHPA